ncbi:thiol reductant ABC exporter subunit CydD [Nocardioides flavescens]|uniref:Thiol reductant ABC exporter subunit CydD n=1 Tax=Nocardioides flavescens TaxID=2691959 RepID=A0A6L7EXM5_9ACTN|nr:thiol reductant ABC exporter subunit CydD [Nocardioides flavescens]MXG88142.1 thiol reductant ABC exporter subunit CydD [Nocardioides flavescens]
MARPLDPRVLPHLRPARGPLAVVVGGNLLAGVLVVAQAFAAAWLVAGLLTGPRTGEAWHPAAAALVATLLGRALVGWVVDVAAAAAAQRVGDGLRETLLRGVLDHASDVRRSGEVGALATRGVAAVEPYLTRYLPALVLGVVLPVLTVVAMATQDLLAAGVVVATLPLVPVFAVLVGVETRQRAERQWQALAALSGHFVDVVRGLPTLVTHRRARAQTARIREVTDRYRRANRDLLGVAFASSAILELVATLSVALVAVVVGLRLADGGLDLRTALTLLLLAPEAYWPLRRVGAEFHAAAEGTATFEAIHALGSSQPPSRGLMAPRGPLELAGASASWPGRERPAVAGVTATVPERGLTVLVGPSGCGKSTLMAVLQGDLAYAGSVRVGGVELDGVDRGAWRRQVASLPQRPWLADATVADNVRLGRPDASAAEVAAALARVGLDLDPQTRLGEDGAGLSAGQRARVGLARVLVADRPLVLLDEPAAHLDPATEALLVDAVRELARTRAVVAVAHRPALVEAADTVVELVPPAPPVVEEVVQRPSRDHVAHSSAPAPARRRPRLLWPLVWLLGVLASTSGVALTATAGWLIARAAEQPPVLTLMVAIVGVRLFGLARPVLRWLERLLGHDLALRELAEQRAAVYDALVPLVPGRLGRRRGDLLASVVDDVDALLDARLRVRAPLWTWLGTSLLTGALAAWLLPAAGAVLLVAALGGGLLAWTTGRAAGRRGATDGVAARAALSRRVLEVVADARPLTHWQAEGAALDRVAAEARRRAAAARRRARWVATARLWPAVAVAAAIAVTATVLDPALRAGEVGAPVAALLLLVPLALLDVLLPVADAGALRADCAAARRRLDDLAALEPAVVDPRRPAAYDGSRDGTVELRRAAAHWPGGRGLAPVDLRLDPGDSVAVVGPSGSGKSTLAALLVRHLAPDSGRYALGGTDTATLTGDDVRRTVGLLDDDPYLFATTLVENVRLARPDASDADVERALREARLAGWLDALPDGLATRLGEGAASVSGGERTRIGLARLLLADHQVVVLDEPTAHLDAPTARLVARDLLAQRGRRTVVWVTHDGIGLDSVDGVLDLTDTSEREMAPA